MDNIPIGSDTKWAYWNRKDDSGCCPNCDSELIEKKYHWECTECNWTSDEIGNKD